MGGVVDVSQLFSFQMSHPSLGHSRRIPEFAVKPPAERVTGADLTAKSLTSSPPNECHFVLPTGVGVESGTLL